MPRCSRSATDVRPPGNRVPARRCPGNHDSSQLHFGRAKCGRKLQRQFEAVSKLPEEDRAIARHLLEGLVLKHDAKRFEERR